MNSKISKTIYLLVISITFFTCATNKFKGVYQYKVERTQDNFKTMSIEQFIFLRNKTFTYKRTLFQTDTSLTVRHGRYKRINDTLFITYNFYEPPKVNECRVLRYQETKNSNLDYCNIVVKAIDNYNEGLPMFPLSNKDKSFGVIADIDGNAILKINSSQLPIKLYVQHLGFETCYLEFENSKLNYDYEVKLEETILDTPWVVPYPHVNKGQFPILIMGDSLKILNKIWKKPIKN